MTDRAPKIPVTNHRAQRQLNQWIETAVVAACMLGIVAMGVFIFGAWFGW